MQCIIRADMSNGFVLTVHPTGLIASSNDKPICSIIDGSPLPLSRPQFPVYSPPLDAIVSSAGLRCADGDSRSYSSCSHKPCNFLEHCLVTKEQPFSHVAPALYPFGGVRHPTRSTSILPHHLYVCLALCVPLDHPFLAVAMIFLAPADPVYISLSSYLFLGRLLFQALVDTNSAWN
jgi:hypothetical protein